MKIKCLPINRNIAHHASIRRSRKILLSLKHIARITALVTYPIIQLRHLFAAQTITWCIAIDAGTDIHRDLPQALRAPIRIRTPRHAQITHAISPRAPCIRTTLHTSSIALRNWTLGIPIIFRRDIRSLYSAPTPPIAWTLSAVEVFLGALAPDAGAVVGHLAFAAVVPGGHTVWRVEAGDGRPGGWEELWGEVDCYGAGAGEGVEGEGVEEINGLDLR